MGVYFAIQLYGKLGRKIARVPIYMIFVMGVVLIVVGVGQIRRKDKIKEQERKIFGKISEEKCKVLFRLKEGILEVLGIQSILIKGIPLILMAAVLVIVGALAILQYCIY
ncbi:MAG: hypothetical protein HDR01_01475 [Lachnospiraceae bacterium]|nr:hypothetical protein [Lachnospiraceae bacterium]